MAENLDILEHFKKVTYSEWNSLFELIPTIEQLSIFSDDSVPFFGEIELVSQFRKIVYGLDIIIVFDWPEWKEGANILKNPDTNFSRFNEVVLCKLITVIVRMDRFSDGHLASRFTDGTILNILRALKQQIESKFSV